MMQARALHTLLGLMMLLISCVRSSQARSLSIEEEIIGGPNAHRPMGNVHNYEFITYSRMQVHPTILNNQPHKRSYAPESDDSFLLELDAFNKTFCLHLHPNYDLIHPDAKVVNHVKSPSILSPSYLFGRHGRKESAVRAKAYRGFVVSIADHNNPTSEAAYSCRWDEHLPAFENYGETYGWARLIVKKDMFYSTNFMRKRSSFGSKPESRSVYHYEGAFTDGVEIYNVKTTDTYSRIRQDKDKAIPSMGQRLSEHRNADMIIFRLSDLKYETAPEDQRSSPDQQQHDKVGNRWCGSDGLHWNTQDSHAFYNVKAREYGIQDQDLDIHQISFTKYEDGHSASGPLRKRSSVPDGCPTSKKVLYMGVVADCSYIAIHGTPAQAQDQIVSNWNVISAIYENTFNVYLGVIKIEIYDTCGTWDFNQAYSSSYTISSRLSDFSEWRGANEDAKAGLWHLVSNGSTYPTVGLAWLNMLCQTTSFSQTDSGGNTQYVSGVAVSTVTTIEWMVVAHEIGHNFGAIHDCTSSLCSQCSDPTCNNMNCLPCQSQCDCQNAYLMSPQSSFTTPISTFSPGSINTICTKNQVLGTCLSEPGQYPVLNGGICGNGLKEGSEQCDCGGETACASDPCCFANCTLKANALCSDSNDNCCHNCVPIPVESNTLCRPATGVCDIPEYCMGNSTCPPDAYEENGLVCNNATGFAAGSVSASDMANLKCASGACTSRKLQCQLYSQGAANSECSGTSGSCVMFCEATFDGCIKVSDKFRDGSPCGNTGTCTDGVCSDPNLFGSVTEWILNNQGLALALFIGGAIILLVGFAQVLRLMRANKRQDILVKARLEADEMARFEKIEKQQQKEERRRRQEMVRGKNGGGSQADASSNGNHNNNNRRQSRVTKSSSTTTSTEGAPGRNFDPRSTLTAPYND